MEIRAYSDTGEKVFLHFDFSAFMGILTEEYGKLDGRNIVNPIIQKAFNAATGRFDILGKRHDYLRMEL